MAVTAIISFEISKSYSDGKRGIYAAQPAERKAGIFNFAPGHNPVSPQK